MGDVIKYLYEKFILRDVLSSITPGAVVVLTAFLILLPEPTLKASLEKLFEYSRDMHWLLYIPLFGVFNIAGFAIECLGRLLGLIRIHPLDKSNFWERVRVFGSGWEDKDKPLLKKWQEAQANEVDVERALKQEGNDAVQLTRERLIVLKQMCATGFMAIFIAGVFFTVHYWTWQYASLLNSISSSVSTSSFSLLGVSLGQMCTRRGRRENSSISKIAKKIERRVKERLRLHSLL